MTRATTPASRLPTTRAARRGMRSASAPPTGESNPIGKKAPAAITTAQVAFPVCATTSAPTATVCIHEPMTETMPPDHKSK